MASRRFLEIKTPLGEDLLFHRMRGREELARLSEFEIDLLSTDFNPGVVINAEIAHWMSIRRCGQRKHDRQHCEHA